MASAYSEPLAAAQVGAYFVRQYYEVLRKQPDFVHQFYTDISSMLRIDGAIEETAMTMMQIHELIMSFNFTGIEIKTAHSLDSWNGGVLVMISGFVQSGEYNSWRKFVQNFFLAPQENGYFVLNDIFQYLDEEQMHQHPAAMSGHDNFDSTLTVSDPDPEPVSGYTLGEATQSNDFVSLSHVEETETVDKYSIPEPHQQVSEADERVLVEEEVPAEEPVGSFPSAINTVQDEPSATIEEPVGEPPKKTYASILRNAKGQSGHSSPHPYLGQSTRVASEWHHVPQHAPQQTPHVWSMGPEKLSSETVEEVAELEEEGQVRSVYVRNLPSSVSASDLEAEFKNFGRIKHDGVLVKSRKEAGIYYAFVEFEDTLGVQNAVKASPILFSGRQIYVEERRPNTGAPRGGRGRGRGRSGLQPETARGRFGGARPFERVSEQDNNERGYNRPRGNGFQQQRGPRQERGILGSQSTRDSQNLSDATSF